MQGRRNPGAHELAALATRQHGVAAHWQLVELGLGRKAIEYRLAAGSLERVHVGVYAIGHEALSGRGRRMGAVLTGGPDAVLSHQSAAALWDLRPSSRAAIDVTVPARGRRRRPGITFHRVRHLDEDDRTVVDGIPVTSVPRTLLDLAEVVRPRALERAFEEAERLRLLDVRAVERLLDKSTGRRGQRPLRALLREYREPPPTRSELERAFLDLCRAHGLPLPEVNVRIGKYEVDMLWREQKLIVELDGRAFHDTGRTFERDRVRDAELQLEYRVVRITYRRLNREPAVVAETIRRHLGKAANRTVPSTAAGQRRRYGARRRIR